jgi:hypothetical protein
MLRTKLRDILDTLRSIRHYLSTERCCVCDKRVPIADMESDLYEGGWAYVYVCKDCASWLNESQ